MTRAFAILLALGFLPVLSMAEEQDVERGHRVRVTTTAGERLTGRVGEKTSDALVVELDEDLLHMEKHILFHMLRPHGYTQ